MPALQQNQRTFSANSQSVDLDVRDMHWAALALSGTFVATVSSQGSLDGTNFFALNGVPSNSATPAASATAPGAFVFDVRPWAVLRAITTAYTSGSPAAVLSGKQQV